MAKVPLKVAIDVREALEPQPAGKGMMLRFLIEALLRERLPFQVILLCRREQKAPRHWPVWKIKTFWGGWHWRLLLFLLRRPDIALFVSPLSVIEPALLWGKKSILLVTDLSVWRYPREHHLKTFLLERLFLPLAVRRTSRIVAISSFTKKELLALFPLPAAKIKVMPLAPALTRGITSSRRVRGQYLLYLGTLEPRKNIERLLKAYRLASQKQTLPPLYLIGKKGWKTGRMEKLIRTTPNVFYLGYLTELQKKSWLQGASGFLYPSLYEGFGLPPLEALSLGVPTLVGKVAALPEVVGKAALLVNPWRVESIAFGLRKLLEPRVIARLSRAGPRQARRFSWQRSARILIRVIDEALGT